MIRLGKLKLFLLGVAVLVACYAIQQFGFINEAERTTGYVLDERTVIFRANGKLMVFAMNYDAAEYRADIPAEYLISLQQVPVLYKKDDPMQAKIYTFFGFWFENIAYFIVPLFLWSAFSLSYLDKGEYLTIDLDKRSFGKSGDAKNRDRFPGNPHDRMKLE